MTSRLSDPQPHVPENSPDDGWSDPAEVAQDPFPKPVVLPARRTVADSPTSRVPQEAGLRIDSRISRNEPVESAGGLEVQEIGSSVVRLDQSVPPPPKVERQFTFHERPVREETGKNRNGEGHDWGKVHRHPVRWIVGMGAAVCVLVVSILLLLPLINSTNAPKKGAVAWSLTAEEAEEVEGIEALNRLLTVQPEALQIFRAYSGASLVEDVVPLIKDGRSLEETLRRDWRPLKLPSSWAPDPDSAWNIQELSGRPYGVLEGHFPDNSRYAAYFTWQGGRLLLDWKATVAYGTAPFVELAEGKGDAGEIRGEITASDYYSAVWPEGEYRSYRLTSPDRETSIWCYTRIGGAADEKISPLFNQGEIIGESRNSRKITLRLTRGAAESLPNQWLIGEMLHIDWATP